MRLAKKSCFLERRLRSVTPTKEEPRNNAWSAGILSNENGRVKPIKMRVNKEEARKPPKFSFNASVCLTKEMGAISSLVNMILRINLTYLLTEI